MADSSLAVRAFGTGPPLIALHGFKAQSDIVIEFTGLRPGEKMHEDLVNDGEATENSDHGWILRSRGRLPEGLDVYAVLETLRAMADDGDVDGIRRVLAESIPEASLIDPDTK